jgi:uncharacterized membrane protein
VHGERGNAISIRANISGFELACRFGRGVGPLQAACKQRARDVSASLPVVPLPSSAEPELCVVARRNDSLGARGRWTAFCMVAATSLALGAAFVVAGAWPVLPWSLVEIGALGVAFVCLERRAGEWERLIVQGDRVIVERVRGGAVVRREWSRYWLRVDTAPGRHGGPLRVMLRSAGEECEFGAALADDERRDVASRLRRLTGQ